MFSNVHLKMTKGQDWIGFVPLLSPLSRASCPSVFADPDVDCLKESESIWNTTGKLTFRIPKGIDKDNEGEHLSTASHVL